MALLGQDSTHRKQRMHHARNSASGTAPGGRNGAADALRSSTNSPATPPQAIAVAPVAIAFFRNSRRVADICLITHEREGVEKSES